MRLRTLLFALLGSCLDPTEIMVEVTTDFACPSLRTNLFVGGPEALTSSAASATKDTCSMRRVRDLVVVPRAMTTKNGDWWDVPIGEPVTNITAGRAHTCALGASGAVYCWGAAPAGPGSNQPKRIAL